jgi:hypothetical protein
MGEKYATFSLQRSRKHLSSFYLIGVAHEDILMVSALRQQTEGISSSIALLTTYQVMGTICWRCSRLNNILARKSIQAERAGEIGCLYFRTEPGSKQGGCSDSTRRQVQLLNAVFVKSASNKNMEKNGISWP